MGSGFYGGFGKTKGSDNYAELDGSGGSTSTEEGRLGDADSQDLDEQVFESTSEVDRNVEQLKVDYPITKEGNFGRAGKHVRIISSNDPEATSEDFYRRIGQGGVTQPLSNGHGTMTRLKDGTLIVHRRITSTKGSPAVEITIVNSRWIKSQKIHFVREEIK